ENKGAEEEAKSYVKIPDLLIPLESCHSSKNNPFSFFFSFSQNMQMQVIDEIPFLLLTYTLQSSHPLPIALAVLQRTLRSGCFPVPQTHVLLTSAWLVENNYGIQFVFYFIYVNLQIAFAFLVAALFLNVKTATVTAYIVVFGTRLVAAFLFPDLMKNDLFSS
ncbi:hypothetical protein S245_040819, partial [Arachis hypogaea]